MQYVVRLETLHGQPHLVRTAAIQVPHTDHYGAWDGRYGILAGTSIGNDGGHKNAIAQIYRTRAAGRDRLEIDLFLDLSKVTENQKTAFSNGDFKLIPMAFGAAGIPSHFEITFLSNRRQYMSNCSSNLTVTEKQDKEPEPLVVQSLEEAFKRLRSPAEQIDDAKSPDHVEESDSVDDVLRKLNSPATSLEDLFKKQLAGNSGEAEPLIMKSLEEAFRERHAKEQQATKADSGQKPKVSAELEGLEPPIPFPVVRR